MLVSYTTSQPFNRLPRKLIMNSLKKLLLAKSILAAAIASSGIATPAIGQTAALQANILGTPNDGVICRSGYTPSFNGSSLKCSKAGEIKVPLACLNPTFQDLVVRAVGAVGHNNNTVGLDVCDKTGGVTITSSNNISNFNRGSDYVDAKQDDAQIAVRAASQRQAEATALGVSLGEVEVEIGTAVTDTTSGDSTDKSKVPLTFFTFAKPTAGIGNPGPIGLPATVNSTSAFVPRALPR
jgi:hypothetical protein